MTLITYKPYPLDAQNAILSSAEILSSYKLFPIVGKSISEGD